jgi:hypothetical protein
MIEHEILGQVLWNHGLPRYLQILIFKKFVYFVDFPAKSMDQQGHTLKNCARIPFQSAQWWVLFCSKNVGLFGFFSSSLWYIVPFLGVFFVTNICNNKNIFTIHNGLFKNQNEYTFLPF